MEANQEAGRKPANQFRHFDPRDDVTHTATTREEMIEKADKLGFSDFAEVDQDGKLVDRHVKVGNDWQLASEVKRQQDAAARVEAFGRQVQNGLRDNETGAQQTPEQLAEVAAAFREFGQDMDTEMERRAAIGIEARNIAHSNIVLDAKHDKLAALPQGDIAARLEEASRPEPNALPPEVSRQWATLDAQEFAKLQTPERQEDAAINIAANMRANADYRQALEIEAPDLAAAAREADAENDRKIAEKEARKAGEAEALRAEGLLSAGAGRDADAFDVLHRNEAPASQAQAPTKTPAQALQDLYERNTPRPGDAALDELPPAEVASHARADFQDYKTLDPVRRAEAAHIVVRNLKNRDYSTEFVRQDPEAAQDAIREVSRQAEAPAKQSSLSDAELDAALADQEARIKAQEPVPMASMPGHSMAYNDTPGMAGAEIHTPDDRIIAFGGKPAIEQFAEENKLTPEDRQTLLDLDSLADKYRGQSDRMADLERELAAGEWEPEPEQQPPADGVLLDDEVRARLAKLWPDRIVSGPDQDKAPAADWEPYPDQAPPAVSARGKAEAEALQELADRIAPDQQPQPPAGNSQGSQQAEEVNAIERDEEAEQSKAFAAEVKENLAKMWGNRQAEAATDAQQQPQAAARDEQIENQDVGASLGAKAPQDATAKAQPLPKEIEDGYIRVGSKFHYAGKPDLEAFEDKGNKLETRSNGERVAHDLVAIAEARGWENIKVRGSEEFKRQVWLEASLKGIEAKGYKPTDADKALLEHRKKELAPNSVEAGAQQKKEKEQQQAQAAEAKKTAAQLEAEKRAEVLRTKEAKEGTKAHPELIGAYAVVAAAALVAKEKFKTKADQEKFVGMVRDSLAERIAKGERIPEVKIQDRDRAQDQRREQDQDKNLEMAR